MFDEDASNGSFVYVNGKLSRVSRLIMHLKAVISYRLVHRVMLSPFNGDIAELVVFNRIIDLD